MELWDVILKYTETREGGKMPPSNDNMSIVERLRRIRDMLLGTEPSLVKEIKEQLNTMETTLNEIRDVIGVIEKATSLGGSYSEIPRPPQP